VPGLLGDARFREGFGVLARLGLTFDAWLYHPQIDELADLARAFPQAKIVLDHVGGPIGIGAYAGRHKEILPGWKASIQKLAQCPNVSVKLGGLGMRMGGFGFEAQADPPSSETLAAAWRPYIETCIEALRRVTVDVRKQPGMRLLVARCAHHPRRSLSRARPDAPGNARYPQRLVQSSGS
jgi:predicted TIM-barrel fold metal-dependent hydrolase